MNRYSCQFKRDDFGAEEKNKKGGKQRFNRRKAIMLAVKEKRDSASFQYILCHDADDRFISIKPIIIRKIQGKANQHIHQKEKYKHFNTETSCRIVGKNILDQMSFSCSHSRDKYPKK